MGEISLAAQGQSEENLDVSVVILTHNSGRTIEGCVRSVIKERPKEILAVDTRSRDKTLNILMQYGVRVLFSPSNSLGYCRQLGVENARGKFVMFLDSDAELGCGCIRALRSELEENGWAGIHAQILSQENETYWQRSNDEVFRRFFNRPGPRISIGTIAGMFRRELVLSHPFDPRMRRGEDHDLCRSLAKDKHIVGVSTARAVVYHVHRRELSEFARQHFNYGRYGGAMHFKKDRANQALISPFWSLSSALHCALRYRRLGLVPYWVVDWLCNFLGLVIGLSGRSSDGSDSVA
jgi:glycosyltransferase involved in cell wall biosynthesis